MKLKSVKEIKNLKGKKVLLRVDFNVPLDKKGQIIDDFKIKSALKTINYLIKKKATVIILSHLGRPDGRVVKTLSNKPIAVRLSKLLKKTVVQLNDVVSPEVSQRLSKLPLGQVAMLENVRFHPREKMNCKRLAKKLASYADIYVNDAFAVSHRQNSSLVAITEYLPSFAGLLLEEEVSNLSKVLESKAWPKVAIIGGAKIETKIKVIKNLLKQMDFVLLGGMVANSVLKAMDYEIGRSKVDDSQLKMAQSILHNKLRIPVDVVVASNLSSQSKSTIKAVGQVGQKDIILDLGPDTVALYSEIIKSAKLVVWNGPLGYFEISEYKKASGKIARLISNIKAKSIIGGGETVQMIEDLKLRTKFDFVSTGGGAMLEFLEGKLLPAIKPLIK